MSKFQISLCIRVVRNRQSLLFYIQCSTCIHCFWMQSTKALVRMLIWAPIVRTCAIAFFLRSGFIHCFCFTPVVLKPNISAKVSNLSRCGNKCYSDIGTDKAYLQYIPFMQLTANINLTRAHNKKNTMSGLLSTSGLRIRYVDHAT